MARFVSTVFLALLFNVKAVFAQQDVAWVQIEAQPSLAAAEQRVLLTRDRGLLKRRIVVYGHWVRDTRPRRQLLDVMRRYALAPLVAPWTRCARCNGLLTPVAKAEVMPQLEPKTKLYYENFQRCAVCGQVFWQGSHFARMQNFVDGVLAEVAAAPLPGSPTGA